MLKFLKTTFGTGIDPNRTPDKVENDYKSVVDGVRGNVFERLNCGLSDDYRQDLMNEARNPITYQEVIEAQKNRKK